MSSPALRLPALTPWRGPSLCEVCRGWSDRAICTDCVERHAPLRPRCARCGLGLGLASAACGACLQEAPPFERTVCAVDYGFPWDGLVAALKFQDRTALANPLAALMAQAIFRADQALPELVLPVPLAPERLAERGYNQAWELARRLAPKLGLKADASLLQRPIARPAQQALDRAQRLRNLRGSFMVDPRRRAQVQGRRLALVDDVMTTGATLRAASATLLRAGAASVDVWVFARTPEH